MMAAVASQVGVVGPQDLVAEDNLVAALLFAAASVDGAARAAGVMAQARQAGLSSECFYRASRGILWETGAGGIVDRGEAPEIPAVLGELERTGKLEEAGSVGTVLGLAVSPPVCGWSCSLGVPGGWQAPPAGDVRDR